MAQTLQDKAVQLPGLVFTSQGGHSTERWSEGQLTGSLPHTGVPCQRSVLLAGPLCAVARCWGYGNGQGFAGVSRLPCSDTAFVCLSPWLWWVIPQCSGPLEAAPCLPRYPWSPGAATRIPQDWLTRGGGSRARLSLHPSLEAGLFSGWGGWR